MSTRKGNMQGAKGLPKKNIVNKKTKTSLRKVAFFAFVLGTLMTPSMSFAAEETPVLEAPVVETGTVVVSATRTEQLLEDVSATMEVFTAEDIKKLGANNVMQILRTAQNVSITSKLSIRGMPQEGTTVLINGRKPAGELHVGSGANRTLETIDVNRIERIEVLAGPSSALYGSATGGVINIITKKSQEPSVMAGFSYGNKKLRNYYSVDSGKLGNFDFLANLGFTSNIPTKTMYEDKSYTPWTEYYASEDGTEFTGDVTLGYDFNDDHRLTFYGNYFTENYFTENVTSSFDKKTNEYSKVYTKNDPTDITRYGATLEYTGTVGDHMYSLSATYTGMEEVNDGENTVDYYTDFTAEFQDTWMIHEQHTLTFGAQYKAQTIDAPGRSTHGNETTFAAYIQDEMRFFDETLLITPAIRYDHYESFGGNFSPKLGVVWKFLEDHRLKANFGLGFRAPSIDELYRDNGPGSGTRFGYTYYTYKGNPDLKPEESVSWDVRYEGGYENVNWGITYYWNEITNQINGWEFVADPKTVNGKAYDGYFTFLQIDKARTSGIEANIGVDFLDYFRLSASYTYLDARNTITGEYLSGNAMNTWQAMLEFNQPDWGTSVAVWTEIVDHAWTGEEWVHYNTMNASVRQTFAENYTVFASATNIFNTGNKYNSSWVNSPEWNVGIEIKF